MKGLRKLFALVVLTMTVQILAVPVLASNEVPSVTASENTLSLDERQQILEDKKVIIKQRVEEGIITQEQADTLIAALEKNIITCNGDGTMRLGQEYGIRFGFGRSATKSRGNGRGFGRGNRSANRMTCPNYNN